MSEESLGVKAREALRHIRTFVMHYGKVPSVRELMGKMNYKSPRSAMLLLEELEMAGFLAKKIDGGFRFIKDLETGNIARTVSIPLVGAVNCGIPILAEENIQAHIPVSVTLVRPGAKYFFLKAHGDSMNEVGINEGDLILVKQQSVAENGQNVIALIEDEATVKEFHKIGSYVTLYPRSSNPKHQPIILNRDFQIQGIVVAVIPIIN